MEIRQATTGEEIEIARVLFREYAAWLQVDLCFQKFSEELANLPGLYAPPRGRLLLAWVDREAVACVGLRPLAESVCEMKRLFVRPAFRGQKLGRRLALQVIADARSIGYASIVLDTLSSMETALQLYERLGFARRSAYYDTPLKDTVFMELKLGKREV
jgi:ribosomal protein S18 acetylase RimI-like enzyme